MNLILTFADTLKDAVNDLKTKRMLSVPAKYRDPSQSDKEVCKEQNKRRRSSAKEDKKKVENAQRMNVDYVSSSLFTASVLGDDFKMKKPQSKTVASGENFAAMMLRKPKQLSERLFPQVLPQVNNCSCHFEFSL